MLVETLVAGRSHLENSVELFRRQIVVEEVDWIYYRTILVNLIVAMWSG